MFGHPNRTVLCVVVIHPRLGQPYVHPPPDSSRFRADCPLFFTMLVKETSLGIADVAALHRVALCHHRGAVVRRVILREDLLPLQLAARPTSMGWRASPTLRATEQAADAAYAHSTHWALKRCVGPEPGTSLELVCAGVVRLPTSRVCLMARFNVVARSLPVLPRSALHRPPARAPAAGALDFFRRSPLSRRAACLLSFCGRTAVRCHRARVYTGTCTFTLSSRTLVIWGPTQPTALYPARNCT